MNFEDHPLGELCALDNGDMLPAEASDDVCARRRLVRRLLLQSLERLQIPSELRQERKPVFSRAYVRPPPQRPKGVVQMSVERILREAHGYPIILHAIGVECAGMYRGARNLQAQEEKRPLEESALVLHPLQPLCRVAFKSAREIREREGRKGVRDELHGVGRCGLQPRAGCGHACERLRITHSSSRVQIPQRDEQVLAVHELAQAFLKVARHRTRDVPRV
ncbi:hypothetical protein FA95DRAFT_1562749, partial [Auriscalpium vulgare]